LPDYERHLANNLGYGAQACYRGPRLYDSEETKDLVKRWVAFFKAAPCHPRIGRASICGGPTAGIWDGVLHVNPDLTEKGCAVLYNPAEATIPRRIALAALLHRIEGLRPPSPSVTAPQKYWTWIASYRVRIKATLPPGGVTWFTFR
jgi:hypothetical protein